jgi:Outer membrane protein beta-barrel domain
MGLLLLGMQMTCCTEFFRASFEGSTEKESGPSAIVHQEQLGVNMGFELMRGMGGYGQQGIPIKHDMVDWMDEDRPPAVDNGFLIATNIEFVQKGSKTTGVGSRLNYLEVQPDALYARRFTDGGQVFGGLGPYLAYGVGGKTGSGMYEEASFGSNGYKRFDAGLNLEAGYELSNSLQFTLGYDLGLYDKSNDPSDFTSRNRTVSINIAYSINKIISAFKRN